MLVTLRVGGAAVGVGYLDAFDACRFEADELARVCDAISISILPNPKTRKRRISAIHHAISVVVQLFERFKAVGCLRSIVQQGVVAKQFSPAGDLAVA